MNGMSVLGMSVEQVKGLLSSTPGGDLKLLLLTAYPGEDLRWLLVGCV